MSLHRHNAVGSRRVLDLTRRDWTIHSSCSSSILLNCCNSPPSPFTSLTVIRWLSLPCGALLTFVCAVDRADAPAPVFLRSGERGQLISRDPWQTLPNTCLPGAALSPGRSLFWPGRGQGGREIARDNERESSALFSSGSAHTFLPLPGLLWPAAA